VNVDTSYRRQYREQTTTSTASRPIQSTRGFITLSALSIASEHSALPHNEQISQRMFSAYSIWLFICRANV